MQRPQPPTPALVSEYVQKFDTRPNGEDKALSKLLHAFPKNDEFHPVLFKVLALNDLYSTNIKAVRSIAKHILQLEIDIKLAQRAPNLVNEIAAAPIRRAYSFATKYCSWHVPDAYPIFDKYVKKLICEYRDVEPFSAFFWKKDLEENYVTFKGIIEAFRSYYGLMDFTFKDLDKFLWLYGIECFRE